MRTSNITGSLNRDIEGRFSIWTAGTRVRVFPTPTGADIERLTNPTGLLLMDMMAGVPMDALTLDEQEKVCDCCLGKGDVPTVGKYGGTFVTCHLCGGSGKQTWRAATPATA
jgi:hypothetical protein